MSDFLDSLGSQQDSLSSPLPPELLNKCSSFACMIESVQKYSKRIGFLAVNHTKKISQKRHFALSIQMNHS